ncbi:DUF2142 domain-containing protein [Cellulomonas hominis]|uniref:DUF2142 domain-containing protein n=1 Tax=Cellulomonas hominis TaxID=156981 RepID=UPI001443AE37|nr:DUF2142 domain-containing protein [Cellulomonas hominis]NKY09932.1 DUF2142 domain-containing protein [Cellulomonas hominis]
MTATTADPPAHRTREGSSAHRRSTAQVFWWAFAALLALFSAWIVANPLTAAPDEPAHITKAGAVVRGQLVGQVYDDEHPGWGHVDVPAAVGFATQVPNCFAFQPETTAACIPDWPEDPAETIQAVTTASTYNPLYYAIVGLPSLAPGGPETVYLMRAVSAVLCALALAWAFAQAATVRRADWVTLAVLLAMTPMVVYMGSAINPASLEICAALALWVGLSALVRDPDPDRLRSRLAGFAVIASVFVNLRGLSPLFLAIIAAVVVLSAPWRSTWAVLRERAAWPWIALVGVASALALVWMRTAGTLESDGRVHHPDLDFWTAVQWSLGDTSVYVSNMIGQFGWVDTNLPVWVQMTVATTVGILVVLALAAGSRRERAAILLLALATIVVPVVIHATQAKYLGIVWQGRYFLPAAVGLPVVAGYVLARTAGTTGRRFSWRATLLLSTVWAGYQLIAFGVNVHRYTFGASSGWVTPPAGAWAPPLPVAVLSALVVLACVALVALCLRTANRAALDDDARGRDDEALPTPVSTPGS